MNADESHIMWREETSQTDRQEQFMGEEQREDNAMIKNIAIQKMFTPSWTYKATTTKPSKAQSSICPADPVLV